MANRTRNWFMASLVGLLVACGGGGGGDRATGVAPGPGSPGQPIETPPPVLPAPNPAPYAEAETLLATITDVDIGDDGVVTVDFQLTDEQGTAIIDLEASNVRFTLAKLQESPLGNLTGTWQSYINRIETADSGFGPGTEDRLQATYEREEAGFANRGDGTYTYTFAQSVTDQPEGIPAQAELEGLDLSYEPNLTHRVVIQFDGSRGWANPVYDWVPATGATSGIFTQDIAATANCNRCHDPLGLHGGNRREIQYCVTCHNPGSTDANSGNTVDMKVMIHKIHRGAGLPSVEAGGSYVIWGYRNTAHDYSTLHYPQDIRNCVNCHTGSQTGAGLEDTLQLTSQGDNWNEYPSMAACGSCHDDLDFSTHKGGQVNDLACALCHSESGEAGSIRDSHRILAQEARGTIAAEILSITNTAPGETPLVNFRVFNPQTGEDYDILNDKIWTDSSARLRVRFAWDTRDYHNTGNGEENASSVPADAKEEAIANGDGSYRIRSPIPIPDGSEHPGIAATGSGVAVIEGRAVKQLEEGEEPERVSLTNVHQFFSIDEPDGIPVPRRADLDGDAQPVVELEHCQACHVTVAAHGGSRADNIDSCVTCHNARNTDLEDRLEAEEPPADGLKEQVVDFKVMIHGIHAAGMREVPLQVEDEVFDEESVHYPGDLSNCETCHADDTYLLPLADGVLAPTVDTGEDLEDPTDDTVVSTIAGVCSSCHDSKEVKQHMISQGANFSTTQAAIDSGEVVESCTICHGEGHPFDVGVVHDEDEEE